MVQALPRVFAMATELLKHHAASPDEGAAARALAAVAVARVPADAPAEELAARFREGHHSRISVVENGRLIGQIDQRDVMRLLLALDRLKVDAEQDAGQGPLEPTAMRGPQFVRRHSSPREHVQDT